MLKKIVSSFPESLKNYIRIYRDKIYLAKLPITKIVTTNLATYQNDNFLSSIMNNTNFHGKWACIKNELATLLLPENTGGVNSGDQRAIAYLIWKYKPKKVLEIGTHIGCSSVHISAALRELDEKNSSLVTVDIRDVNDEKIKPWLFYKSPMSPKSLIEKIGFSDNVNFITQTSLDFLKKTNEKFDFIFLDGGHSSSLVYQELPLASKLLNENGIILLHDYYPNNIAIWNNKSIIPGPYMATQRFINEGNDIIITPLGELPWETKRNSNYTSLAICLKKNLN